MEVDQQQKSLLAFTSRKQRVSGKWDWAIKLPDLGLMFSSEASFPKGSTTFYNSPSIWRLNVNTHEPVGETAHSNNNSPHNLKPTEKGSLSFPCPYMKT